jgi:hypothetical protein
MKPSDTQQAQWWSVTNDFGFIKNKRDCVVHTINGPNAIVAPIITNGVFFAGGAATAVFSVPGVLPTDSLIATNQVSINPVQIQSAFPGTDQITVNWTADPGPSITAYQISRLGAGYRTFFVAKRPVTISEIAVVWTTAEAGGTLTLQIEKLGEGVAEGSGVDVLEAGVDLSGTANTTVFPKISTADFARNLRKGDRLALKASGSLTTVDGITLAVEYIYQ